MNKKEIDERSAEIAIKAFEKRKHYAQFSEVISTGIKSTLINVYEELDKEVADICNGLGVEVEGVEQNIYLVLQQKIKELKDQTLENK
jgi:hypothetical protein